MSGRAVSLLLPLLLGSAAAPGAEMEAQEGGPLTAVYVHGDAVETPYVLPIEDLGSQCLWVHTYQHYQRLPARSRAPENAPMVTLSFFTRDDWAQVPRDGADPRNPPLYLARFHTRFFLAPPDVQPYVQFRKEAGLGRFKDRGRMPLASEYYLAHRQIPTRLDRDGRPVVRRFSGDELETVRGALPADFACAPGVP